MWMRLYNIDDSEVYIVGIIAKQNLSARDPPAVWVSGVCTKNKH